MGIILVILSFIITLAILSPLKTLLVNAGAVRKNYQGKDIPIGLGLVLFFSIIPSFFLIGYLEEDNQGSLVLLALTITVLVGFIDDLLGNHSVKGLKGHFKMLVLKNELTSGALKAITISLVSLLVSLYLWKNLLLFIANFVILILMTNAFNLFDVRPGRAIKFYLLIWSIHFLFFAESIYLTIILASILVYGPLDFKGKAMLGDTGSNFLGMACGLSLIFNLNLNSQVFIAFLLIILHIYTEKRSLSVLIEKITLLRLIDNWGR
jgi:UDP-GlcNAc:undecaprenyl-phosphate GlcNAc-1-phosphate transferase